MPKPHPTGTNNPLGALPGSSIQRRDPIEEALASLYRILIDLDELAVRVDQAIRRASVVGPVLLPARERLAQIRARLAVLHTDLGAYWRAGQLHCWE